MNLTDITSSLRLSTSTTAQVSWQVGYTTIDKSGATAVSAGAAQGQVSVAGTVEAIPAPGASISHTLTGASAVNTGTVANVVRFLKRVSGTDYPITPPVSLAPGETLFYAQHAGWQVLDQNGRLRTQDNVSDGPDGTPYPLFKVGTGPEAGGQWYCWAKDAGYPGAWAPGTPGLSGRATDGTLTADAGCVPIKSPASGTNYLTAFDGVASQPNATQLWDVLWVNSGIVVTTTAAQTINSVAFPARDVLGSVNGTGCLIGLLVTTATTNAAAITNMTVSYTNQSGVAGRTATLASFPATAVIGTVVWFQLAAGDTGVQSIQSITLGTSLAAGAVSLIVARPLVAGLTSAANLPLPNPISKPGVRLYNGVCALPFGLCASTSAVTINFLVQVMER